ncbi:hypothetical protein LWI29_038155 [Acer saccharum]|uniref:Serine/threonine specific protein phosphatases domain-containing protein n=1 Tax=Acer saccharum TaxID=4024 RepID=A0AA39SWL2_ACESA|nr:hypothetical protein LWI29_038155 [Acer saccharum]
MELVQGEVDEFKDIMGIINKEMDLDSFSNANLRCVFTMFSIANGVANGQSKPYSQADVDGLWCSSVDGMVAVARQVIDYVREMAFVELDEQQKRKVLGMLRSACNIISKHCVIDSSQQSLLEKLELEVDLRTDERLVGLEAETQTKEQDPSVQASSMPSISWPQNGCITLEWIRVLISTFKWASWKDPKDFWNLMPVAVVIKLIEAAYKIMEDEENCVKIYVEDEEDSEIVVVGDIHGQFHDLISLFEQNAGFPSYHRYFVFNEVCTKFGKKDCKIVYEGFLDCFKALPLASIIANSVYTTHGGLFRSACSFNAQPSKGMKKRKLNTLPLGSMGTLEELAFVNRFLENVPEYGILTDVLWSNPSSDSRIKENTDGVCGGIFWGPDYTETFLRENHLKLIIRLHEGPDARAGQDDYRNMLNGYCKDHDVASGKLFTLFSAPSYPQFGRYDNVGAYAVLKPPKFDSPLSLPLKATKRPEVTPYDGFLYNDMDLDEAEDSTSVDSDEDRDLISRDVGDSPGNDDFYFGEEDGDVAVISIKKRAATSSGSNN